MTSNAQFITKASAAGVLALAAAGLGAALLAQPAYAAEAIAITDVEGLKAMESNKTGSYYLAKDIDLSGEKDFELFKFSAFQGTLDGKGHAIKNFTRSEASKYKDASFALIDKANNATIKNLSLTGVKIAVETPREVSCAALVRNATGKCKFENIKTSGTIKVTSSNTDPYETYPHLIGGLVVTMDEKTTFSKCTNGINIDAQITGGYSKSIAGIVANGSGTFTKCANKGAIVFKGTGSWGTGIDVAGISASGIYPSKLVSCTNSGNISVTLEKLLAADEYLEGVHVSGLTSQASATSCGNKGAVKLTVKNGAGAENITVSGCVSAMGGDENYRVFPITKCYNKGAVTLDAGSWKSAPSRCEVNVAGVVGCAFGGSKKQDRTSAVTQCYNKGAVKASTGSAFPNVGGVCADFSGATFANNYNAGTVTGKGNMYIGGLIGSASMVGKPKEGVVMEKNYNVGKVTLSGTSGSQKKWLKAGALTGAIIDMDVAATRNAYNNYYTSGKPYAWSNVTWKAWTAQATKVGSISSGSCPKLSSSLWTYSSKYKRLILKNNKE